MRRIRAVVVDDSSAIRRLLAEVLGSDPEIEVVGSAADGQSALSLFEQAAADVVTLDVEMPGLSGIDVLAAVQARRPGQRVIMFSATTRRAAAATLEALALGASDYVTKPSQAGSQEAAREQIKSELLPKIHALCDHLRGAPPRVALEPSAPATPARLAPHLPRASPRKKAQPAAPGRLHVLAIGASTGGPNALDALLSQMPGDFALPIVVVQHMPPVFTAMLAERLAARCPFRVAEASDGADLLPGRVYLAPGDFHLEVLGAPGAARLKLHKGPRESSCRPAVDVLFRSLAATHGAATLAVVLTGMGQDGLLGAQLLHAAGAQLIAQDEQSSVVWGMPARVAEAGLGAQVLPLSAIAPEIVRRSQETALRSLLRAGAP